MDRKLQIRLGDGPDPTGDIDGQNGLDPNRHWLTLRHGGARPPFDWIKSAIVDSIFLQDYRQAMP
jgi:hypothetical protein